MYGLGSIAVSQGGLKLEQRDSNRARINGHYISSMIHGPGQVLSGDPAYWNSVRGWRCTSDTESLTPGMAVRLAVRL